MAIVNRSGIWFKYEVVPGDDPEDGTEDGRGWVVLETTNSPDFEDARIEFDDEYDALVYAGLSRTLTNGVEITVVYEGRKI